MLKKPPIFTRSIAQNIHSSSLLLPTTLKLGQPSLIAFVKTIQHCRPLSTSKRVQLNRKAPFPKMDDISMATKRNNRTSSISTSDITDYSKWSHSDLISRVLQLEDSLNEYTKQEINRNFPENLSSKPVAVNTFDFSRYNSRLIALKFAYIGKPYQGFEYHVGSTTEFPTVEEKLFEALLKARLVPPKTYLKEDGSVDESEQFTGGGSSDLVVGGIGKWIDTEKWEYTKCGRTDRGVSAFGQVIGIRVRSNRRQLKPEAILGSDALQAEPSDKAENSKHHQNESTQNGIGSDDMTATFDEKEELQYVTILNRLLPASIRVLAWCPNPPPNFSARFNCQARTYHYFFTNPPSPPMPGQQCHALDIQKMQEAAKYYEGLHDFRNLCKIDASKQITNFMRRVESTSIERVGPIMPVFSHSTDINDAKAYDERPEMFYFRLTGSAFLWHQVRHMVGVLFLVGQGLESPSVVKDLLDLEKCPTKPQYNMADDRPLVLWDCRFDEKEVPWVYPKFSRSKSNGRDDVFGSIWELWHHSNMDALLSGSLLATIYEQQNRQLMNGRPLASTNGNALKQKKEPTMIVNGSPMQQPIGNYVPLMKRARMEPVEIINEKYAARKSEEWRARWSVEAKRSRGIADQLYDGE